MRKGLHLSRTGEGSHAVKFLTEFCHVGRGLREVQEEEDKRLDDRFSVKGETYEVS